MNFIDLIIIILMIVFGVKGYLKGFIHELFSILIIILSLVGALLLFKTLAPILSNFIGNRDLTLILSFISIFVLIAVLLIIIRNTLTEFIDNLNFTDIDYLLGVIFGLFKGLLICGIIFIFLKNHPVPGLKIGIDKSFIFPYLEKTFIIIISILPDKILMILKQIL